MSMNKRGKVDLEGHSSGHAHLLPGNQRSPKSRRKAVLRRRVSQPPNRLSRLANYSSGWVKHLIYLFAPQKLVATGCSGVFCWPNALLGGRAIPSQRSAIVVMVSVVRRFIVFIVLSSVFRYLFVAYRPAGGFLSLQETSVSRGVRRDASVKASERQSQWND
jgi:hypothetical protein